MAESTESTLTKTVWTNPKFCKTDLSFSFLTNTGAETGTIMSKIYEALRSIPIATSGKNFFLNHILKFKIKRENCTLPFKTYYKQTSRT